MERKFEVGDMLKDAATKRYFIVEKVEDDRLLVREEKNKGSIFNWFTKNKNLITVTSKELNTRIPLEYFPNLNFWRYYRVRKLHNF